MDPRKVIEEMERWDDLEINPDTPNPPGTEVIARKRNKLDDMWQRMINLCSWDAPELYAELKKLWTEYLERRRRKVKHFIEVSPRVQNFDWDGNCGVVFYRGGS